MSLVNGLHHVSMKCSNMEEYERVIDFYQNIIELPIKRTWDKGIMFDLGNSLLEIFNNADESLDKGVIRHFAFATNDVDKCVERVTAAGYEVFMGPKEICIPSEPELPARMAFCKGPLGEEIEFFQEKGL